MEAGTDKWSKAIDRVVDRTATRISDALDKMVRDLPEGAAPQMALGFVVAELTVLQPWLMQLIMEDVDLRETYDAAVARIPATAGIE